MHIWVWWWGFLLRCRSRGGAERFRQQRHVGLMSTGSHTLTNHLGLPKQHKAGTLSSLTHGELTQEGRPSG